MKKQDPSVYCYVKNKKWGEKCHVNTNFKKTEVAVLILSKGDFITKLQGYYIITGSIHKKTHKIQIYLHLKLASNTISKLIKMKGEVDTSTITGDFNIPLQ